MNYVVTAIICIHCVQITNERLSLDCGRKPQHQQKPHAGKGEHNNATRHRDTFFLLCSNTANHYTSQLFALKEIQIFC